MVLTILILPQTRPKRLSLWFHFSQRRIFTKTFLQQALSHWTNAVPVLAGSASYALSEAFSWKEGLYRNLKSTWILWRYYDRNFNWFTN